MEKYDVIIIGAGIGGLSCGALLAKSGFRTLILEQHHNVGGCCSTIRKNGFSFDLAAEFLLDYSLIQSNLEELGVEDKVEFLKMDPLYEFIFPDFKVTIPKDMSKFEKELIKIAPEEEENIHKFLNEILHLHKFAEETRINHPFKKYDLMIKIFKNPTIIKYGLLYGRMNWDKFLDRYFINKKLKAVLSVESIFLGLPPSKIHTFAMASIIGMEHKYGLVYPKNGMISLAEAYVSALNKYNGTLKLNSKVSKLIIEGNECTGIELSGGEKILSNIVVSNADIIETFHNLVGKEHLEKNFSTKIELLEPSLSAFKLCIGTDAQLEFKPLILKCPDYDIEHIHKKIMKYGIMDDNYCLISIPSLLDSSIARQGTHVLKMLTIMPHQINGKPWSEMSEEDHESLKQKFMERMIRDVTNIIPNLSEHIVYKDVITPATFGKIVNRYGGPITTHTKNLDKVARNKTPINNLYFVGSSAYPGGGVSTTIVLGIVTSNMIIKCGGMSA